MSEINISIEGGTSKRLLTAGKFCEKDIVVTAEGGSGGGAETCQVTITSTYYQSGVAGSMKRYTPEVECFACRDNLGQYAAEAFTTVTSANTPPDLSRTIAIKGGDILSVAISQNATPVCDGGVEPLGSVTSKISSIKVWSFEATSDGTITIS